MEIIDFLYQCTPSQKAIVKYLHDEMTNLPGIELRMRYKLPFYYRRSWVCYMNPLKSGGVELCFTKGYLLSNAHGLLSANGRTMISGVVYNSVGDIDLGDFLDTFHEALIIDEDTAPKKRR